MKRGIILTLALLACGAASAAEIEDCHRLDDVGASGAVECYATVLKNALDPQVRAEAYWRIGDLAAANAAFREAIQLDPNDPGLLARWGHLFLAAHQFADAEALFQEALELDEDQLDALLGLARLYADRFENRAGAVIERILQIEPAQPDALVLLARLHLEVGELADARALLTEVIEKTDSVSAHLQAFALLAAADHVASALPSQWTERALAVNPSFGEIYSVPAYFYVITRRYKEAVELLEKAVALDPTLWDSHTELGINLLRLNRFEQARAHLEAAYEGDPFNAEVVNTLRLLDSLSNFDEIHTDDLILRIHKDESAVLRPYVRELVDETIADMAGRYGFEIDSPIVIELYQHHDDFAVRTAGLPGLGILGATFGDVIVMDGPSAKGADEFDWYSALWHELAHVVTLNATANKVSRWFAEGVSVYEEWHHGPSQGVSLPLHFIEAVKEDRLLPVADLDEGFIRPKYPDQIGVSYLQAGLVCLFIADEFENGLRDVLRAYADGMSSTAAIEKGLGVEIDEFDRRFREALNARVGPVVQGLDEFNDLVAQAREAAEASRWEDVKASAAQAIAIYPDFIGAGSPYLIQAKAQKELGETEEELATLERYWSSGGRNVGAMDALVEHLVDAGRIDEAIDAQRTLVRAVPLFAEPHARLGELLGQVGLHQESLREHRAVLALGPHDRATAHYNVAAALHALDRTETAKRELLMALEIAPRFKPALALLLEVSQSE